MRGLVGGGDGRRFVTGRRVARGAARAASGVVAVALVVAGCTGGPATREPAAGGRAAAGGAGRGGPAAQPDRIAPLAGAPLPSPTGLRLLVASDPPFVLDVDRGTVRRVTGIPGGTDQIVSVAAVGRDAVVLVAPGCGDPCKVDPDASPDGQVFAVGHGETAARLLGRAWEAIPALGGDAVWLRSDRDATHCTMRLLGLDGRVRRPAWPLDCATAVVGETAGGLLASTGPAVGERTSVLLDPGSGRVVRRFPNYVYAAVGSRLVGSAGPLVVSEVLRFDQTPFTVTETRTGQVAEAAWPSGLGSVGTVRAHPDGRHALVDFGSPGRVPQVLDLWLLDTATRRWQQLPGMPAGVALKATSMVWAGDGRLVLLAAPMDALGETTMAVGVWRPGQERIQLRKVELPGRSGGTFALLS